MLFQLNIPDDSDYMRLLSRVKRFPVQQLVAELDGKALVVATRSRSRGWNGQVTDNAPSRSIRRSGHPILASAALRLRGFDRDLICGEHYGQRPSKNAAPKGRTDGSTDQHCITVQKSLANREPSTDGYELPN
jgi:hypothetical protein